jgi:hypothetical protein
VSTPQLPPREPLPITEDQRTVAAFADVALDTAERILLAMGSVDIKTEHVGHQFMTTLLRASVDHARASAYLLAGNPLDLAGSAMVLHRAQIEQILRGIFFGLDATPAEIEYFHKHDDLPKRRNAEGRMARLTVADLAAIAQTHMDMDHGGQFISMHANVKSALNGMVHGGKALLALYWSTDAIGCSIPPRMIYEFTANSVAMAHLSLGMLVGLARNQDVQAIHNLLEPPHLAFEHFNRTLTAAIAALPPDA